MVEDRVKGKYTYTKLAFADKVKSIARLMGWNGEKDEKGRILLQTIGTECGRAYNPDVWVDNLGKRISNDISHDIVAVTDCRFVNEIEKMKNVYAPAINAKVITIRVIRYDISNPRDTHQSETDLDGYKFDHYIYNTGTLQYMKALVNRFVDIDLVEVLENRDMPSI